MVCAGHLHRDPNSDVAEPDPKLPQPTCLVNITWVVTRAEPDRTEGRRAATARASPRPAEHCRVLASVVKSAWCCHSWCPAGFIQIHALAVHVALCRRQLCLAHPMRVALCWRQMSHAHPLPAASAAPSESAKTLFHCNYRMGVCVPAGARRRRCVRQQQLRNGALHPHLRRLWQRLCVPPESPVI